MRILLTALILTLFAGNAHAKSYPEPLCDASRESKEVFKKYFDEQKFVNKNFSIAILQQISEKAVKLTKTVDGKEVKLASRPIKYQVLPKGPYTTNPGRIDHTIIFLRKPSANAAYKIIAIDTATHSPCKEILVPQCHSKPPVELP